MTVQDLPAVGDKMFFMHREVIVTKIYRCFQLIKIHYPEEQVEFAVDFSVLSKSVDLSNVISLGLLRRDCT